MKNLEKYQQEHLVFFNKFSELENEEILTIIKEHYLGSGKMLFSEIEKQLEEEEYSELSKNLLLFGAINEEYNCRIFFKEELDGMEDEEIIEMFNNDYQNKHILISYFAQERLFGFNVDEIKLTFNVDESYLKEHFASYFLIKI